jgi:hypothetical protein
MRVLYVAPYPLDVPGGNSTAILRLMGACRDLDPGDFEARAGT